MRTVTVEEHFASPYFLDGPGRELRAQASKFGAAAAKLLERLCDVGGQRIAEMDDAGIDMQLLSLTSPGTEQLEPADAIIVAREANQFLEGAVKKNPARFAGLAAAQGLALDVQAKFGLLDVGSMAFGATLDEDRNAMDPTSKRHSEQRLTKIGSISRLKSTVLAA